MTTKRRVVAIDGPAGAGKSTAAVALAQKLGWVRIDTGALYRALALKAAAAGIDVDDAAALATLCAALRFCFLPGAGDGAARLEVDGADVSAALRTSAVAQAASQVSRHAVVRQALLQVQRDFGAAGNVVMEGRDIGTVIFPDAAVKIFLTASPAVRAARRAEELRARGEAVDEAAVLAAIRRRDAQDAARQVAPLRPAPDAHHVDSSAVDPEALVERLLTIVQRVLGQV